MHFTQEDYRKIEQWLYQRSARDSEFPTVDKLNGRERIPIVQDNKNKVIEIDDFINQISSLGLTDLYNVTLHTKQTCTNLDKAISLVPTDQRKLGLIITFYNECGQWVIYQFTGKALNQWNNPSLWNNIIKDAIDEQYIMHPDDEDIVGVIKDGKTYLKFKDREYSPKNHLSKGMIILRKNLYGTDACSIDDEDHLINRLSQIMLSQENTIYVIKYDFDLNGGIITVPEGCTLWFQGGTINNGSIYLSDTILEGILKLEDIGTAKIYGNPAKGQIATFDDESTQMLKWWNGIEWITIQDSSKLDEVNSKIDEYNKDLSSVKTSLVNLNNKVEQLSEKVSFNSSKLSTLEDTLSNLNTTTSKLAEDVDSLKNSLGDTVRNYVSLYLQENLNSIIDEYIKSSNIGIDEVRIGDNIYKAEDGLNYIILPEEYPSASKTKGNLILKWVSNNEGGGSAGLKPIVFNGSEDIDLTQIDSVSPGPGVIG